MLPAPPIHQLALDSDFIAMFGSVSNAIGHLRPLPVTVAAADFERRWMCPGKDEAMKMRSRLMVGMLLACTAMGCAMPIWSPNPDVRARQLIYQSESLRHIPEIWERIWMLDQPDHATPYRVHGGVI